MQAELTFENTRQIKFPWKQLKIILLMAILVIVGLHVAGRIMTEANFYDCFNQGGIDKIFTSSKGNNIFLRSCKLPTGMIITQEVKFDIDEWVLQQYYITNDFRLIPGVFHQIWPNPTNTPLVIIEELLSLIIK